MEYGKMWRCGKVFAHLPNYMQTQMCLFSKSTQSNFEGYIIRVLSAEEMQASSSTVWKFQEEWWGRPEWSAIWLDSEILGPRNWQKCGPGVNGVIRLICVISLLPEAEEKPEPRIAVVCQFWVCTQPSLSSAQSARSLEMLSQAMYCWRILGILFTAMKTWKLVVILCIYYI